MRKREDERLKQLHLGLDERRVEVVLPAAREDELRRLLCKLLDGIAAGMSRHGTLLNEVNDEDGHV